jgi:hypothetical protein
MPIHFRENQYNGVNAHLHSLLQREGGGWESFHGAHITHLSEAIDNLLPQQYFVISEDSLQLSFIDVELIERRYSRTRADISIYGEEGTVSFRGSADAATPTATIPIVAMNVEEEPLRSLILYEQRSNGELLPVTRIELLSPANKPGGSHFRQYHEKRREALVAGMNLIELDYLHETRPVIALIPSYPDDEPDSYPYTISVTNPHPDVKSGKTDVYGFAIDSPIPVIDIPLAGKDFVTVDFGEAYSRTFSSFRYYGTILVDYEQLPANFESYSEADQQRIRERMKLVAAKATAQ